MLKIKKTKPFTWMFVLFCGFIFFPFLINAAVKGTGTAAKEKQESSQEKSSTVATGAPTREIQDIEKKMGEYKTGEHLTAHEKANNARIKRDIISGTFDINELSRLALDKNWNNLLANQRSEFVTLMTDLLETKAIFSKEQTKTKNKSYTVKYLGDWFMNNHTKALTKTKVIVPKENAKVDIEYKMRKAGNSWKIYDVVVDEASLVENYRFQFNSIILKNGYPELVRRMQKKLQELKSKNS